MYVATLMLILAGGLFLNRLLKSRIPFVIAGFVYILSLSVAGDMIQLGPRYDAPVGLMLGYHALSLGVVACGYTMGVVCENRIELTALCGSLFIAILVMYGALNGQGIDAANFAFAVMWPWPLAPCVGAMMREWRPHEV